MAGEERAAQHESAAEQLLQRMRTVLYIAEDTNFAAADSYDAIDDLFESIGRMQQGMVAQCEDLPFLYFARSFAVIMEEVVQQLQTMTTVLRRSRSATASSEEQCSHSLNSTHSLALSDRLESMRIGDSQAQSEASWSSESRREMQLLRPNKVNDFSPQAIEGRITIFNVALGVREKELRALLHPFGRLLDFHLNSAPTRGTPYALAKLESSRAADEAVARLNGRVLNGVAINVRRATYDKRLRRDLCADAAAAAAAATESPRRSPAAAAPTAKQLVGSEAWRREMQRLHPHKKLDFSEDAIEGRIMLFRITNCASADEVRELLRPYGLLIEFHYPPAVAGKSLRYALAKLQSNRVADEAVARLSGTELHGVAITVKRAEYWAESWPSAWKLMQQAQQLQPRLNDGMHAAGPAADQLVGSEAWRRDMQQHNPHKKLYFTRAAIEGRIMLINIVCTVYADELKELLRPFGPLLEFYYPLAAAGKTLRFAHAKLESNRMAHVAVTRLDGLVLHGRTITATRALYWSEPATPPPQLQHPRPVLDWFQARVVAAPAAEVGRCSSEEAAEAAEPVDEKVDSDEESEELGDVSNSSFFSVD